MSKDVTMTTGNDGQEEMHIIEDREFREVFEISDFNDTGEQGILMSFYVGRTIGVAFGLEKTKLIRDYLTKIIEKQKLLLSINNEQEVPNEPSNG